MTQELQPGNVPAWSTDDPANQIADIFANETWPELWPGLVRSYANTAARNAELSGLSTTDRVFAYVEADGALTRWTGTAWEEVVSQGTAWTAVGFTAATGWTLNGHTAKRRNGIVSLQATLTRTGAAISAGNIGNIDVLNMPPGGAWTPSTSNGALQGGPVGSTHSSYASSAGTIVMTTLAQNIAVSDQVQVFGMWML